MSKQIYILTPVFNRCAVTDRFLEQLKGQTYKNWKAIVVDDGSNDGTKEMLATKHPEAVVIHAEGLWWAGCLQKGLAFLKELSPADESIILIANDDVEMPPNYLEVAVKTLSGRQRTLLGSVCKFSDDPNEDEYGIIFDLRGMHVRGGLKGDQPNCFATRGLFLRWGDFAEIGEFRSKLLPHYYSDYEFTIRANQMGYDLLVNPEVWVRTDRKDSGHRVRPSQGLTLTWRQIFSNLNRLNPLHFSIFILLRCPAVWKFLNQIVVIRGFLRQLQVGLFPWQSRLLNLFLIKPAQFLIDVVSWIIRFPFRVRRKLLKIRRAYAISAAKNGSLRRKDRLQ